MCALQAGAKIERVALSPGMRRGQPGRYARILLRLRREGVPLAEIAARTGLHPGSIRRILRELARKMAFKQRPIVPTQP